jgi:hypothetical protein
MIVVLTKLVRFMDFDGEWVILPTNTELYVDVQEGIALWGDLHFYISKDEYSCIN